MKLVDLNICIKMNNTKKVIEFLENINCDIIALQEVTRPLTNTVFEQYKSKLDIDKELCENYPHEFFGPLWIANGIIKNKQLSRDFGGLVEQGNQIISKFKIESGENVFYQGNYTYGFDATHFRTEDHARAALITQLNISNGKLLQIINIHGIWNKDRLGDERTINQSKFLIEAALEKNIPTIILGDFNLIPDSESIKLMDSHFINLIKEYGIKSTRPTFDDGLDRGDMVVDYIFVNNQIKVNDFKVVNTDISDHLPLILDFEIL